MGVVVGRTRKNGRRRVISRKKGDGLIGVGAFGYHVAYCAIGKGGGWNSCRKKPNAGLDELGRGVQGRQTPFALRQQLLSGSEQYKQKTGGTNAIIHTRGGMQGNSKRKKTGTFRRSQNFVPSAPTTSTIEGKVGLSEISRAERRGPLRRRGKRSKGRYCHCFHVDHSENEKRTRGRRAAFHACLVRRESRNAPTIPGRFQNSA